MTNYNEAHAFASYALAGKTDKSGAPLIAHAERIAASTEHKVLAILHDVLEDSSATLVILLDSARITLGSLQLTLTREVGMALQAITRQDGEVYAEYIQRVRNNGLALPVKMLDLLDHQAHPDSLPRSLQRRYARAVTSLS